MAGYEVDHVDPHLFLRRGQLGRGNGKGIESSVYEHVVPELILEEGSPVGRPGDVIAYMDRLVGCFIGDHERTRLAEMRTQHAGIRLMRHVQQRRRRLGTQQVRVGIAAGSSLFGPRAVGILQLIRGVLRGVLRIVPQRESDRPAAVGVQPDAHSQFLGLIDSHLHTVEIPRREIIGIHMIIVGPKIIIEREDQRVANLVRFHVGQLTLEDAGVQRPVPPPRNARPEYILRIVRRTPGKRPGSHNGRNGSLRRNHRLHTCQYEHNHPTYQPGLEFASAGSRQYRRGRNQDVGRQGKRYTLSAIHQGLIFHFEHLFLSIESSGPNVEIISISRKNPLSSPMGRQPGQHGS